MPDSVKLTVDGVEIEARPGSNVLEAAREKGIYIPYLCWHPILKSFGACRMCVVEIDNMRGLPASCTTQVTNGMVVNTNTESAQRTRKEILELTLSEHPHGCLTCHRIKHCGITDICLRNVNVTDRCVLCPQNERCELQDVTFFVNLQPGISLPYKYRQEPLETRNPFIDHDMNLCIMCGRCVRTCNELEGVDAIAFVDRGDATLIGTSLKGTLDHSGCTYCGSCVDVCPVGAIVEKDSKWSGAADQVVTTVCSYCSVGCQLNLQVKGGKVIRAGAEFDSPTSKGLTCAKGKFGEQFIYSKERLTQPLLRQNGRLVEASWDEALNVVASRLVQYRGEQFGVLSLGKGSNEEHYLLQKFARSVMGSNNVGHVDNLSPTETLEPLQEAFGVLAMSSSVEDISQANCFLAVDTDTTSEQPVLGAKLRQAVLRGATLITIDPRETELALSASLWLRPRPGTEPALLQAMAKVILDENLADQEFLEESSQGLDDFRTAMGAVDLDQVEKLTGVQQEKIRAAARSFATNKPAPILFTTVLSRNGHGQGLTQSLLNLAVLTGSVSQAAGGIHPLCSENNSQGASDMGLLPGFLPGYLPVAEQDARERLAEAWGVSALPDSAGQSPPEMMEAARRGELRALVISAGGNHLAGLNLEGAGEALEKLEFLVVQDLFLSELAQKAQVVLPVASFAEEDGTFTNLERRIQRVQQAVPPPGEARPGWWIISEVARRMGVEGFTYGSPVEVMNEIARLTPIYGGVSYERLSGAGLQWPVPTSEHPGTPALPLVRQVPLVVVDVGLGSNHQQAAAPFLVFNYLLREIDGIRTLQGQAVAEINRQDAAAHNLADGGQVELVTEFGSLPAKVKISNDSAPGAIFIAHPWVESLNHLLHKESLPPPVRLSHIKVCSASVRS